MAASNSSPSVDDLVVVVPGIQGTKLVKDGEPVWALSLSAMSRALRTLGDSVKSLQLPADIGDDSPGDGVQPAGLFQDVHGLPGLGIGPFVGGYSDLSKWLRETMGLQPATAARPGNLVEFGYDWRLSNRHSARQLCETVQRELKRWRDDGHPDAKLVFICHSMGGLVARYYLEVLGGAEETRTLVTVGTPHRGSVKALKNLVNGLKLGKGPFKFDVGPLVRSFPSAYQLLPTYRCIDTGDGRQDLASAALSKLDATRVADAMAFQAEIEQAAAKNSKPPYGFRMVVGTRQPTFATARVAGDRVEPLLTIDGNDECGDGTVPRFASIPLEIAPNDMRQLSSAQRHGWLQQHGSILDDLHGILTAKEVKYMAAAPELPRQPGIQLPEVLNPGEKLVVRAQSADDSLLLEALLTTADGQPHGSPVIFENLGDRSYEAVFEPPSEGAYCATVRGVRDPTIEPVTDALLVLDAAEGE